MLRRKIGLLQKRRGEECKERRLPMTANILDDQEDQNFEKKYTKKCCLLGNVHSIRF